MSSQTNKDLWKRWMEVWNGNLSIADEIIAPNFVAHLAPASTSPAEVRGPDGLKQWIGGGGAPLALHQLSPPAVSSFSCGNGSGSRSFSRPTPGGLPPRAATAV